MRSFVYMVILCLWLFCSQVNGQFAFGECMRTPIMRTFDKMRYLGVWYEIQRFDTYFERGLSCVKAEYGLINSTTLSVVNSGLYLNEKNRSSVINGKALVPNPEEPNKLQVQLPIPIPIIQIISKGVYDVWSTDYKSYALVYSCRKTMGTFKTEYAWILARTRTLGNDIVFKLREKLGNRIASKMIPVFQGCNN